MEIVEKTLVVQKPLFCSDITAKNLLGIVKERSSRGQLTISMKKKISSIEEDNVIPLCLCEKCDLTETPEENLRKHLADVIVKLTLMVDDLKCQVEKLSTELQSQRTGPGGIEALQKEVESLKRETEWLAEFKKTRGAE